MLKLIGRSVLACAVVCAAAGGAMAQTNAQKMAGGTWVCTGVGDGLSAISKQSYAADGTSTVLVMIFGETDGTNVKIVAEGVGTWNFVGDRLDEMLTRMTATYADIGGAPALDVAQDMLDGSMVNVTLTNNATFDGPTLQLVDADNVVTDCAR